MADDPSTRNRPVATDARQVETRVWLRILALHGEIFGKLNRALLDECGLSLAKFDVLAQVDRCGDGVSLGRLSHDLKVTGGNVSGLVQRLVADGFITREMSATDRRSFVVRQTAAGRAVFARACAVHRAALAECFGAVPGEQLDAAYRALAGLAPVLPVRRAE